MFLAGMKTKWRIRIVWWFLPRTKCQSDVTAVWKKEMIVSRTAFFLSCILESGFSPSGRCHFCANNTTKYTLIYLTTCIMEWKIFLFSYEYFTEYFYDWNTGTIYHIIGREIWNIFCLWWTQIVLTSTSSATAFYQIFRDNLLIIGKHIVFALVFLKIEKNQTFLKTSNFSLYLPVMD